MSIDIVNDNYDKQLTYRRMMARYKKAIKEEFYLEALLIAYGTIEDRLRAFIYYIGGIRKFEDENLNVNKTKKHLRKIYFGSYELAKNKPLNINKLSDKIQLIKKTLEWSQEFVGVSEFEYLNTLKSEYEGCLDIGGMLEILELIDKWRVNRNAVIHGLLNKSVYSLNESLYELAEQGYSYARFIDDQVKKLKRKNIIRKQCGIIR